MTWGHTVRDVIVPDSRCRHGGPQGSCVACAIEQMRERITDLETQNAHLMLENENLKARLPREPLHLVREGSVG